MLLNRSYIEYYQSLLHLGYYKSQLRKISKVTHATTAIYVAEKYFWESIFEEIFDLDKGINAKRILKEHTILSALNVYLKKFCLIS